MDPINKATCDFGKLKTFINLFMISVFSCCCCCSCCCCVWKMTTSKTEEKRELRDFVEQFSQKTFHQILDENPSWYNDAASYWEKQSPKNDGMLGGLEVNDIDIKTSTTFLNKYFSPVKKRKRENDEGFVACDCGGGIGRVTFNLLLQFFSHVDIVEPNESFLDVARQTAGEKGVYDRCGFVQSGLQEVEFEKGKYDVVWVQWVVGYLRDDDFEKFLKRAQKALKPGGMIIIKDNHSSSNNFIYDDDDKSICRSYSHFLRLFRKLELEIVEDKKVLGFPKGLFPVRFFALR